MPPEPFLGAGRGGALAMAGRPDGRPDGARGSTRSGTFATGDSREVRGGFGQRLLRLAGRHPRDHRASACRFRSRLGALERGERRRLDLDLAGRSGGAGEEGVGPHVFHRPAGLAKGLFEELRGLLHHGLLLLGGLVFGDRRGEHSPSAAGGTRRDRARGVGGRRASGPRSGHGADAEHRRLADAVRDRPVRRRARRRRRNLGVAGLRFGLVRAPRVGPAVDQAVDHRLRRVVDLDELDPHAGRTLAGALRGVALPHDAPDARDDGLIAREADLELEQRARRKRAPRLDVDAAPAHVVSMVLDELVDRRALVADVQAHDLHAAIFASVLGHRVAVSIRALTTGSGHHRNPLRLENANQRMGARACMVESSLACHRWAPTARARPFRRRCTRRSRSRRLTEHARRKARRPDRPLRPSAHMPARPFESPRP